MFTLQFKVFFNIYKESGKPETRANVDYLVYQVTFVQNLSGLTR